MLKLDEETLIWPDNRTSPLNQAKRALKSHALGVHQKCDDTRRRTGLSLNAVEKHSAAPVPCLADKSRRISKVLHYVLGRRVCEHHGLIGEVLRVE